MSKRSAFLTAPPKSDPCRPPLGPDQSSPPAERAALEQGGPAVRRPSQASERADRSRPSGVVLDDPVDRGDLALGQAVLDPRDPGAAGMLVGRARTLDDERDVLLGH